MCSTYNYYYISFTYYHSLLVRVLFTVLSTVIIMVIKGILMWSAHIPEER